MMVAGITLAGGATVTTSLGALIFFSMPSDGVHFTGLLVGVPMMVLGASLFATGIPLWAVGAQDAPDARDAREAHPAGQPALRSTLIVGLDRAAIRWEY